MTERDSAKRDLRIAAEKLDEALRFLEDPEVDIWRTVASLQVAADQIIAVRERLIQVSREALVKAFDVVH